MRNDVGPRLRFVQRRTRLLEAGGLALFVTVGGTIAYMVTEDLGVLDAFYLTIITISTVGFSEPGSGFGAAGQVVTVVLIIFGVGTVLYVATTALEFTMEDVIGGTFRDRTMSRRIGRMENHTIICGYGRIGRHVYQFLSERHVDVLVVDHSETSVDEARASGLAVVLGDATHDDVLEEAGIDRAAVLIASVHGDPDNMAIVLSARAKRRDLRIVARANEPQTEGKLILAGADRVVTPAVVGAARIAAMADETDLTDVVDVRFDGDTLELNVEEIRLGKHSRLIGSDLANSGIRELSGVMVAAVITSAGAHIVNPMPDLRLDHGVSLVVVGTADQIDAFRELSV